MSAITNPIRTFGQLTAVDSVSADAIFPVEITLPGGAAATRHATGEQVASFAQIFTTPNGTKVRLQINDDLTITPVAIE